MSPFISNSLRTLACALVAGSMLMASPVKAGVITLINSAAGPLDFTSEWEWLFGGVGGWATAPVTALLGAPDWEVTLQGFAGGGLRDTSAHLVAPHPGEIAPNVLSFFDYPGAIAGVGPIFSWINHPAQGHINVYSLTTNVIIPGVFVQIIFEGEHVGDEEGVRRREIPEPSSFVLLGAGLLALFVSRRRSSPLRGNFRKA